ncbi:MAG: orotidine-5'-phosphate decarboxylase [Patescibacteria group bacterium]
MNLEPDASFNDILFAVQANRMSHLCVGLDPDQKLWPIHIPFTPNGLLRWAKAIVDATAEYACIFKPNAAFWEVMRAERQLEKLIAYIQENLTQAIFDGKRGDIGATAEKYAQAVFGNYNADAATVNPYLGLDTLDPWIEAGQGRAIFVLCHTTNPGAKQTQEKKLASGEMIFEDLAHELSLKHVSIQGDRGKNCQIGLVMAATFPDQIKALYGKIAMNMPLLLPGVGKQEGDLKATVANAKIYPFFINVSSKIGHASTGRSFARDAALAAKKYRDEINQALAEAG